ncbi:hypothetical protein CCHR01_12479, partial [Colletotrichum chrysophilum]
MGRRIGQEQRWFLPDAAAVRHEQEAGAGGAACFLLLLLLLLLAAACFLPSSAFLPDPLPFPSSGMGGLLVVGSLDSKARPSLMPAASALPASTTHLGGSFGETSRGDLGGKRMYSKCAGQRYLPFPPANPANPLDPTALLHPPPPPTEAGVDWISSAAPGSGTVPPHTSRFPGLP